MSRWLRRRRAISRRALFLAVALVAAGCASTPPVARPLGGGDLAVSDFAFDRDTFAFPNEIRAFAEDRDDLYANYCFVVARGLRQFFQFARFDPRAPALDRTGYVARVRQVVARAPWQPALTIDERVVIPGYAGLREFSRAQESAVKEGMGGRFWTLMHWTIWRTLFPIPRGHQAGVFDEIERELGAGRLVQLLVTNQPILELNHTVVAFAARRHGAGVDLAIWDPNEPARPGVITFDAGRGTFWATRVYATRPQAIRVFRMYHSPLL
ncbi:MAG TPA: hypothetical protein VK548_05215 [Candidatus Acidoferrum sp.]|nr:hypothetical protein [Candidatus Acidoferrum sp.]